MLYIDLGTANTLMFDKNHGFILNEPSVLTIRKDRNYRGELFALGRSAKQMMGKTPAHLEVFRPLREGVIADFERTSTMLRGFIKRVSDRMLFFRPELVISLPCLVSQFEKQAVEEVGLAMGAKKVHLIEEPVAAAIGAGLDILKATGHMVVDIGGGTTEIAVISCGGIIYSNAVRVGGNKMDEDIVTYVKNKYQFVIGEPTAEKLKIQMASALPIHCEQIGEMKGQDLRLGLPRCHPVSSLDIYNAIEDTVVTIIQAIKVALEQTPPEIAADLASKGMVLAGGGALIRGLPQRIELETGLKVQVASDPLLSIAFGGAASLRNQKILDMIAV